MKCPYCAEEIKDDAIFCRYCHAEKINGVWQAPREKKPQPEQVKHPSQFTFRTAGAFFLLSALFELMFISSEVTIFGAPLKDVAALLYHLVYVGVFIGMGLGLWRKTTWGLQMMIAGTVIYTVDKLQNLFFDVGLSEQLDQYGALLGPEGEKMFRMTQVIMTITIIMCWWGFLFYIYLKRDYFKPTE